MTDKNEDAVEIQRLKTALETIANATWASKETLLEMANAALGGARVGLPNSLVK